MGPYQFVFVACLASGDPACERIEGPIFGPDVSLPQCLREAPAITGAWAFRNPGRRIESWDCRPVTEAEV